MSERSTARGRAVGMTDVARAAGVSPQTVSRALRGESNVSADARARVNAAVEQLGYRMNNAARMLSSGRSRTLGLVLLQSGGYYSRSALTAGVETEAQKSGYAVTIATITALDTSQLEGALSKLADQGVEGIVIAVPLVSVTRTVAEIAKSIPTVALDGSKSDDITAIGIDQRAAGRKATEHLLSLGHEQIWHLSGPQQWIEARQRRMGWADALTNAGIEPPPPLEGDWSPASGRELGRIIAMIPDVTAVFAASDEMAFGVIQALQEAGRAVPSDVSVVSVDDIALAAYCSPPLTTVRQDFEVVGATAVQFLTGKAGLSDSQAGLPSDPFLVVRESTAMRRRD